MRISTNTFFESSINRITDIQTKLNKVQQEISSGKKVNSPSDDPIAAAQSIEISQAISSNDQYARNRLALTSRFNQTDNILNSIVDVLQNINDIALQANSGTVSQSDKENFANNLQSQFDQLLQLANSQDSFGNYLLGGSVEIPKGPSNINESIAQNSPNPISMTAKFSEASSRNLSVHVDPNSLLSSTIFGSDLFFTQNNGSSIFDELGRGIAALHSNDNSSMINLLDKIASTLSTVGGAQSEIGNRLNALSQLDSIADARGLQLTQSLSSIQDLDYTKAISELTKHQTILQAAQKTFGQVSSLSLFDYIK